MLARPLAVAIDLEQPAETLAETLDHGRADPLVRWAAVYDNQGKRLASVGEGTIPDTMVAAQQLSVPDTTVGTAVVAGKVGGNALGSVTVALKTDLIAERRTESLRVMALQGLAILGLGLVLALLLSDRVSRSMRRITQAAKQIARGDVSRRLELDFPRDELGEMASAFKEMNERLRHLQESAVRVADGDLSCSIDGDGELFVAFRNMVQNLQQLAQRIATSSSAVASAAAGMFSSVREQEASGSQQNAGLEEIRHAVEALAEASEHVSRDAASVREMADRSLTSTQHTADQTQLVSAHSDRIGEILSLIQDIADKSDLLALNAGLEGTRAGEVGRGFSLIAAEMRRLSEHVMDSVRDIRKLVGDMHQASHASVLATEEGIKLARETAAAAAKISQAVSQQREGTTQVRTAISDLVSGVNEALGSSEETTRNAEGLLQLSHELKTTASNFRVDHRYGGDVSDEQSG
jgi:methyl-accepting chemotaxis protein